LVLQKKKNLKFYNMKTKVLLLALLIPVFSIQLQAQKRSSVQATSSEISDNLDLRAVASIFGEARDLQDFERRLNDPDAQISNLDLNDDQEVDYLRVIETVENRTHLIIVQAVLDRDVYQDVATIDVEKDQYNKVHVQVVGDTYLYGANYIYEPVYYTTPVLYASFWRPSYRPYCSTWNWGYYPSYYRAWNPFPVFRYRNNINISLNFNNNYNYVNYRRSNQAIVLYNSRRSNGYERQHPHYSFSHRNATVTNRYELDRQRSSRGNVTYANRRTSSENRYNTNASRNTQGSDRIATPRGSSNDRSTANGSYSNRSNRTTDDIGRNSRVDAPSRSTRGSLETRSEASNRNTPSRARENEGATVENRTSNPRSGRIENRSYGSSRDERNTMGERSQNRTFSQNRVENSSSNRNSNATPASRDNSRGNAPQRTENQRGNSGRGENRRS
jgi:hypothetical protein